MVTRIEFLSDRGGIDISEDTFENLEMALSGNSGMDEEDREYYEKALQVDMDKEVVVCIYEELAEMIGKDERVQELKGVFLKACVDGDEEDLEKLEGVVVVDMI